MILEIKSVSLELNRQVASEAVKCIALTAARRQLQRDGASVPVFPEIRIGESGAER